ncbi:MAG: nucleoside hydrolase [Acidimicrobiia bacterium]
MRDPLSTQAHFSLSGVGAACGVCGRDLASAGTRPARRVAWRCQTHFDSGAPITLVPLDATNDVPLTVGFLNRLKSDRTTSAAEFVYRVLSALEEDIRSGRRSFWDPLAAAVVSDEDLVTVEEIPLTVVEEERPESGRTSESEAGSRVRVAMTADSERFEQMYLDTVNRRLP